MATEINHAIRQAAEKLAATFSIAKPADGMPQRLTNDESAIQVLRAGSTISILFLVIYLVDDMWSRHNGSLAIAIFHWVTVIAALAFFGASWTKEFRRYWKLWNLFFCIVVISIFIMISAQTREGDSRFVAVLLFPLATAAFVNWGWRWQALMGLACIVLYAIAEFFVPISGGSIHRWMGLLAGIALAEFTAFFMGLYRERLDAQVDQLVQAAAFRETQIATMAHDIRSPVAAIAGFVDLLDDEDLTEEDRKDILARIGTTAWSMDLTVSNVLDLYQIAGGKVSAAPMRLDPNRIVADAASNCSAQAVHKGLNLVVSYGEVPRGNFDPRHLERIARNMIAYSISRIESGEVRLRTRPTNSGIAIEVEDDGPAPTDQELASLYARPEANGNRASKAMLGLHVARALAESVGGGVKLSLPSDKMIRLIAEIPSVKAEPKLRAS
ncbi:MAG TPA: HAMP domain-containing sensor histidine kinase [Candidatus Binataceae bacterium]|nr:HAMP domain-containing sensor histidine kinase [Candidatus Binataceae bacterium]